MKPFLLVLCILFAVLRLFVGHIAPSPAGTYTAFSHIFIGSLLGLYLARRERFYIAAIILLTALETAAFFLTK